MRRNLYDLLGVRPDDDAEQLRKAFLKAAKESHPDHHGDDPDAVARFREITEAYEILRDAEQRAAYDRLLEAESRPLRSKVKETLTGVKRHLVTDAVIGIILVVALAGGYELFASLSETALSEGVRMTVRDPAGTAAGQPAGQDATVERGRPAAAPSPQMPIVVPETPAAPADAASAPQATEVARNDSNRNDSGSDAADQAGAKAGPDGSAKRADGPQDRHDTPSAGVDVVREAVQAAAAAALSGVPGLPLTDAAPSAEASAPANLPGSGAPVPAGSGPGIVRQPIAPAETGLSARIHATMTSRPPASRTPFRHAASARRYMLARLHGPYCEDDGPPFRSRY